MHRELILMNEKTKLKRLLSNQFTEFLCLCIYKLIIDFVFIPKYYEVFGYLTSELKFNYDKWITSNGILILFLILLINNKRIERPLYAYALRFIYLLCIIPAISVYAFRTSASYWDFIFPTLYYFIIVIVLKQYSFITNSRSQKQLELPKIKSIDKILLFLCGAIALFIWAYSGFPVILDLSETRAQRMALRAAQLPTILSYAFMLLGGTMFPFFAARFLDKHQWGYALLSTAFGIILFFVNGMKTWLFLYLLIVAIFALYRASRGSMLNFAILFELMFILIPIVAVWSHNHLGSVSILSQFSRIILVPPSIGFKSMSFFQENELLFLRESILRRIFPSPYIGGSDFYMNYGNNISLTSSRANNGLWGDAFRNFGYFSLLFYPLLFSKTINIIAENCRYESKRLSVFVIFLMIWGAINASYFTWLLTGGVAVIILLLKEYKIISDEGDK